MKLEPMFFQRTVGTTESYRAEAVRWSGSLKAVRVELGAVWELGVDQSPQTDLPGTLVVLS